MSKLWSRLSETPRSLWLIYIVTYLTFGAILQSAAPYIRVARFAYGWQVITIYGLYLVPLSALLRGRPWHTQYAYAIMAIAPIDILGFTLRTSVAYPDNLIDSVFGERNFTLTFVMIASWIPYCGNIMVEAFAQRLGALKRFRPVRLDAEDTPPVA